MKSLPTHLFTRRHQFVDFIIYFPFKSVNLVLMSLGKMRILKSLFVVILILTLAIQELRAQGSHWVPENHRIQYQKFDWKFVASSNFEVYYLEKSEPLARTTLSYLEADFVP